MLTRRAIILSKSTFGNATSTSRISFAKGFSTRNNNEFSELGGRNAAESQSVPDETTHFGFKTVRASEKAKLVGSVFSNVADKYDIMNDVMSAGIHRVWKNEFVNILNPTPGSFVLDVAGGTGDIAFRIAEAMRSSSRFPAFTTREDNSTGTPTTIKERKQSKVMVCDINPNMVEVGKQRAIQRGFTENGDPSIQWTVGDAERLPLPDNSVDAYTIAFGIRNCTNVDKVVREAHRVLKKGGRFLCLEFSHIETFGVPNPVLQGAYDAYSFNLIPLMGQVIANDSASYQYLVESIRKFPTQSQFCELIENEGFSMVSYKNLTFGIAAIHSAFKL